MAQNTYKKQNKSSTKSFKFNLDFFNDRKFHLAVGMFLLLTAFFLLVSFVSYLITGKEDQSVVEAFLQTNVKASGQEVQNWFGTLGAITAHYFIFLWFGLAALLIPPFLFLVGHRIIWRKRTLSLTKSFGFTAFYLLWLSTFIGYFMISSDEVSAWGFLSGGAGFELAIIFDSLMGWGTMLFLIFLFLVFNMYFFDITQIPVVDDVVVKFKARLEGLLARKPKAETETEDDKSTADEDIATEDEVDTTGADGSLDFILKQVKEEVEQEEQASSEPNTEEPKKPTPEKPTPPPANVPTFDLGSTDEAEKEEEAPKEVESWSLDKKPEPRKAQPKEDLELSIEIPEEDGSKEEAKPEFSIPVDIPEDEEKRVEEMENYDPTLDLPRYHYPTPELLIDYPQRDIQVSKDELEQNKDKIVETLINFKIGISSIKATIGPTVTLYEIVPEAGVKISKIKNLEDDIALSLAALGIRIIAPIPGRGTIGIEVPNKNREMVDVKSVITTEKFMKSDKDLPIVLGKTISNEVYVTDLAKMPHLLMAGATGQGKSVGLNLIIASLIYKKHPSQLKFVMVDPKKVELTLFNKLERHFLAKLPDSEEAIITDTSKVVNTLNSLCIEMDNRYDLLKDAGCRNLKEYNKKFMNRRLNPKKGHRYLPYIVLIIDELADLMMTAGKEVETPIARLAQLARAIGIHLIVATQRPSVNVITGIIKANFPARLSFRVTSKIDSRTILDTGGADQLVGMGDMLLSLGSDLIRLQCAFVDTPEVDRVCEYVGDQPGYDDAYLLPEFIGDSDGSEVGGVDLSERDALFADAAKVIVMHQQGSTSLIQRKLKLGYNRAGRLIDQLEAAGIVGPFEGSKAREVLVPDEYALEQLLNEIDQKY
ncbi:FtsK/SpoIIIE family DNA translocase [Marinoscillum furvescens]|uniref:S-DNA-T family DNA segregation ATPase FtsK/SpoIIIE n=1 Tax=Marinoscillum furvescens DSM 4134 TaxID=1122208 RepID=A0A3D9LH08_MARFU|nr:DNA translocase FtsK [Marinoscillum furvescens]REE05764.1 S-DNA-T family DNA segregation ATPase FtsK/SpoIIIE [Marinoscillum furvescens DSM 4134]